GRLLDRDAVLEAEPGLAPTVSGGLLLPSGRRTDPAALTVAAAELARRSGAEVRCHVDVKRVSPGAVVTDGGFERAGTVVLAARAPALREGDESAGALRDTAARVCQLLPAMASIEVETTWSGLRPFTPDELPYIGHLEDGLAVCAGHSSDGILAGAGSGRLVAEMVLATEPFTDPAPFSHS